MSQYDRFLIIIFLTLHPIKAYQLFYFKIYNLTNLDKVCSVFKMLFTVNGIYNISSMTDSKIPAADIVCYNLEHCVVIAHTFSMCKTTAVLLIIYNSYKIYV